MRRLFLCVGVCCGVWGRRLPSRLRASAIWFVAMVVGLIGAWHWKPVCRCVGQWCHGVGGVQVQHQVMDERMAPQLWQGSVAQRVGVVSFRLAWLFGVLHRGQSSVYVSGGSVVVVVVGAKLRYCWKVRSGRARDSLCGGHCGEPLRFGMPGFSWSVPARSLAIVLGVIVVRRLASASWMAVCSLGLRHMLAAMQGTWRGMARCLRRMVGL